MLRLQKRGNFVNFYQAILQTGNRSNKQTDEIFSYQYQLSQSEPSATCVCLFAVITSRHLTLHL